MSTDRGSAVLTTPSAPVGSAEHAEAADAGGSRNFVRRGLTLPWTSPLLAVAGLASWAASIHQIHPYSTGSMGLIRQLPALWWIGVLLVALSVAAELARPRPRTTAMVVALIAVVLVFHGTLPAAESVPRFSAAYYISGFTDYLARTGTALPRLDARMSWFGLYAGAGMASEAMRVHSIWFLRWTPVVLNLAYLFPAKVIANTTLRTSRARWAALAVFVVSNWIDQDYFSPQGVTLLLFLAVLAVAIRTFGSQGNQSAVFQRVLDWRFLHRGATRAARLLRLPLGVETEAVETDMSTPATRAGIFIVVLLAAGASVVAHQLTPVAMGIVLFFLALTGRTRLKWMWLFLAVLVFGWLSWEARPYWLNHLDKIFGNVGQVGSTFGVSVGARLQATSFGRHVVELGRVAAAAVTWLGAVMGFWSRTRRGRTSWALVVMGFAPIAVAGAVSYGGEVALRVLLFSLVPAAIMTVGLLDAPKVRRTSAAAFGVIGLALVVLFPLNRFGNEIFEAIAPSDLAAAQWIHSHVPQHAVIYVANEDEPLYYTHPGSYRLEYLGSLLFSPAADLKAYLPRAKMTTWIYLTRSQYEEGVDFKGYAKNWLTVLESRLEQTGVVTVAHRTQTAVIYQVAPRPPRQHHPVLPTSGPMQHNQPPPPATTQPTTPSG